MLLHFQVCSNSAYHKHSGERYRTNGPLTFSLGTFVMAPANDLVLFEISEISLKSRKPKSWLKCLTRSIRNKGVHTMKFALYNKKLVQPVL